ncbi:MAG: universal stress protein [Salegentibacter sp.]|uniref:Universal stress protein n=1 Tax=Salegentibacter flavus TaxID=287099 RepID=A0A1I4YX97_9FLAO|nr:MULTISPECIES: universal stress protein [Salegentibacter]MDR9457939.1 universal stress protein [Salegentibacter sp.]SFN42598.1 Nucleotide-binding universal stress protein, UspA family [Salegentibacter flavus]
MDTFKNILVAVDFNDTIGELMGYAESIAEKFGSKIWVVHVAEPSPEFTGYEVGPQYIRDVKADEFREEHRQLQAISKLFVDQNIESEALLIQGSTVQTIIEEVKKLNADLLIVGTHKHGFLFNILSENVSLELLKKAEVPFLAIPIEEEK